MVNTWTRRLGSVVFAARWILYPLSLALIVALSFYVVAFLINDFRFVRDMLSHWSWEIEPMMVMLLGFVDALMVANLIVMVLQGSHQIFIHKFDLTDEHDRPQWLDHIDSGILKVKVALSIAGITLVQILKDFVNIQNVDWTLTHHRIIIHVVALLSAMMMALIWRVTHPEWAAEKHTVEEPDGHYDNSGRKLV